MARTIAGINISRLVLESSGFDEGLIRDSISINLNAADRRDIEKLQSVIVTKPGYQPQHIDSRRMQARRLLWQ